MTTTQKTLLITAAVILIIWLFSRKAKANGRKAVDDILGNTMGEAPENTRLFINTDTDFDERNFIFNTPVGTYTIANPNTLTAQYNALCSGTDWQFGWQAPTPGIVLVTLLPMSQHGIIENIIIDLDQQTAEFEYVEF